VDLGIKYQSAPNPANVRSAALSLIAAAGKSDPRAFEIIRTALNDAFERRSFGLMTGAAEALVTIGDERGLATFQELRRKAAGFQSLVATISGYEARLRSKVTAAKTKS
jgi:hypothetical protein